MSTSVFRAFPVITVQPQGFLSPQVCVQVATTAQTGHSPQHLLRIKEAVPAIKGFTVLSVLGLPLLVPAVLRATDIA